MQTIRKGSTNTIRINFPGESSARKKQMAQRFKRLKGFSMRQTRHCNTGLLLLAAIALYMPVSATAETPETALQITTEGNVGIGTDTPGGLLGLKEKSVYLDVDGDQNLNFTDANNEAVTLSELNDNSYWSDNGDGDIYYDGIVGIGTSHPASDVKLDVDGHIGAHGINFEDGTDQKTAADIFPSGAVIFMMSSTCPDHWSAIDSEKMGRFVVITPEGGTTPYRGGGDPLTDKQAPTHTHPIHTSKTYENDNSSGSRTAANASPTENNSESLPYLQLYACVKQ